MNPPKETLYVNNLPDKMKKDELKRNLYHLFSQFGPIVDVVAMKTPAMRGQAFIIYRQLMHATTAMRSLQGMDFFDKTLAIAYAKVKSDAIAKLDGSFKKKNYKQLQRERRAKERMALSIEAKGKDVIAAKRPREAIEAAPSGDDAALALEAPPAKKTKTEVGEAHNVLFLENFPKALLKQPEALKAIFSPFAGFADIRVPPPAEGADVASAFVEFSSKAQAAAALVGLNGFELTKGYAVDLKYAKK
eukprot:TRINITY_DN13780_c0_g1_i1.p1 TRINITY_DN13780_c0_g1~~TRINITY_DN13780_c0_g1_i1.p1  ORF type:complete len:247 (+),score=129.59 TRINITY_DN13780_c0_g1_i1:61-801(+)